MVVGEIIPKGSYIDASFCKIVLSLSFLISDSISSSSIEVFVHINLFISASFPWDINTRQNLLVLPLAHQVVRLLDFYFCIINCN